MPSFTVTDARRPVYALVDRIPKTSVQLHRETTFAACCKEQHEHWMQKNAPKPLSLTDYRYHLRLLLACAVSYHEKRNSVALVAKVIRALRTDPQTLFELGLVQSHGQGAELFLLYLNHLRPVTSPSPHPSFFPLSIFMALSLPLPLPLPPFNRSFP
jgi:hypothetical protein